MESNFQDDLFDITGNEPEQTVQPDLSTPYDPESDDSIFGDQDPTEETSSKTEQSEDELQQTKPDYLTQLLRDKGIDKKNVQFANEKGEIELYDFDDLSDEDKYAILSEQPQLPISDEEINTINFLRQNNINLQEFAQYQRDQAVKEYLAQNKSIDYTVDQLSDEDLFKFDLLDRFPDLTDEEVDDELENAKANEAMFDKKIQALRTEYKQLEEDKLAADTQQAQQQQESEFRSYAQDMVNVARSIDELHGLELEDEDKENILSFLLDKDVNGQSGFFKLFNNPEMCFKMAWYALYGDQAIDSINNYYRGVIEKTRRASQQQQLAPRRVVHKSSPKNNNKPSDDYGMDKYFK